MSAEVSGTVTHDSKNIALLTWLGTLFFGFIPSLFFYLTQKNDAYVQAHAKEALNWSITLVIGCILGFTLIFLVIGFFVLIGMGIAHVIYCLLGAIASFRGKTYRIPSAIRLIQ